MSQIQGKALRQLVLAGIRELLRDRATFFFILIFPFLFLFLFMFIATTTEHARYKVALVQPAKAEQQVQQLADTLMRLPLLDVRAITAEERDFGLRSGKLKLVVTLPATLQEESIQITASSDSAAQVTVLAALLRDMTRPPGGPVIASSVMGTSLNPVEFGLPAVLIMAFFSLALMGTMTPIIQMRERGALRLLGLTPLSRSTFIMGHLMARVAIGMMQLSILLGIALLLGKLPLERVVAVVGFALLGLLMLFALGYMLAGLVPSAEVANGLGGGLMPAILMFCGIILPSELLPDWVTWVAQFIPLTYLGDALRHLLLGAPARFPLWSSFLVLLGSTVLFTLLAIFTFRWDRWRRRTWRRCC